MNVLHSANPFNPSDVLRLECIAGASVREILDANGIREFPTPTVCLLNDKPVLRREWPTTRINHDDTCLFLAIPEGGGKSNPLKIILMVVLWYYAPALASKLGPYLPGVSQGMIQSGIMMVGTALINAIIPPPTLKAPESATIEQSPTYSLSAQGNQARPGSPIPVLYGRHIMYPDYAAQPYTEYDANDDQYLYQVFCLGHGYLDIEQIRIADSDISAFNGISYAQYDPGATCALFHPHVVTASEVSGQEMLGTNEDDYDWIGPFITNPSGTTINKIGFDVVLPRGLYEIGASSINSLTVNWRGEYRPVDDNGNPIAGWSRLGNESITSNQTSPIRRTYDYAVSSGRYEVRARRMDEKDLDTEFVNDLLWAGLKGYLTDTATFHSGVTILAMKMLATNNLSSQSSRLINVIATRKLPAYDPDTETWGSNTATRSAAWAIADALRSTYGADLDDAQIDLDALADLDTLWENRQDHFDGVFDTTSSMWEAVTSICRVGRSVPIIQGGRVRVIRDQEQSVVTALYTPRNIVKGSLQISYLLPGNEAADSVTVQYMDAATWKMSEQTETAFGTTNRPAKVVLFGCSFDAQASREAEYMAKAHLYRRKMVSFQTELDGYIPTYGDKIRIAHDMPQWGEYGDVTAYDPQTLTATLSVPVEFTAGQTHYIGFRSDDGSMAGPYEVTEGDNLQEVVLSSQPAIIPYTAAGGREKTQFAFGAGSEWTQECRVISIQPKAGLKAEITSVAETYDANGNNAVLWGGNKGLIGANSLVDYTSASASELATYTWIGDNSGDMSDGEEGWTIGAEEI